jgi:hypothetical protein
MAQASLAQPPRPGLKRRARPGRLVSLPFAKDAASRRRRGDSVCACWNRWPDVIRLRPRTGLELEPGHGSQFGPSARLNSESLFACSRYGAATSRQAPY